MMRPTFTDSFGDRRGGRLTSGGYERPLYEVESDGDIWPLAPSVRPVVGEWPRALLEVAWDDTAWMSEGACTSRSKVDFFAQGKQASVPAQAVCAECAVKVECLTFALENDIRHGVWGGLTAPERGTTSSRPQIGTEVVYFATAEDTVVKIGTSCQVERRVRAQGLTLLVTEPGSYERERELHGRFARYRIHGEFFRLEGELHNYVEVLIAEHEWKSEQAA